MSNFARFSRISLQQKYSGIGLPFLLNSARRVEYKPRYEPNKYNIGIKWYNHLKEKFPLEYVPTAPTHETGINSFKEFDREYSILDPSLIDLSESLMEKFFLAVPNSEVISREDVYNQIVKETSAGYPFKGKKKEFLSHPKWDDHLNKVENYLDNNIDPFCWQWSQKYELRTHEKAKQGKIRGFCVSPVDHCFLQSQLYYDFNENFYDASADDSFPSAVGMSKFSQGFHKLAMNLSKHKNIFFSDFSGYDSTITPQMLYRNFLLKMKNISMTEIQRRRAEKLIQSVIFSKVVMEDGNVYAKQGGNPSGQTNTIVDNTIITIRLFLLAYLITMMENKRFDLCTYESFKKNVVLKCYGDDAIFSVSDEVLPFFNGKNIERIMSNLGYKIKINHDPVSIEEAEFLSHKFIKYNGIYLPILDEDKVLASLVLGSYNENPLFCLMRALSLRVESWPSTKCRELVADYIHYAFSECQPELQGYYELAPDQRIDLESLKRLWFTDSEIFGLYSGYESNGKLLNVYSQFKNNIYNVDPSYQLLCVN